MRIVPLAKLLAMSPSLLAFDTATERMSLALLTPAGMRTRDGDGGAQASAALIPAALALLADAGLKLRQLDAIAFGRGPGAFTGLRTACAVAQGFAFGAGLKVLAIDSLLIVAEDARAQAGGDDWWVAMDARMDEVYAARYRHDGGRWQVVSAPALCTLEALAARWRGAPPQRVAGSALAAFGTRLACDSASVRVATRALACVQRWPRSPRRHGAMTPRLDAADALPLYLRDKVALTTAERDAARASPADRRPPESRLASPARRRRRERGRVAAAHGRWRDAASAGHRDARRVARHRTFRLRVPVDARQLRRFARRRLPRRRCCSASATTRCVRTSSRCRVSTRCTC